MNTDDKKPDILRVSVADGKYTMVQDGEGRLFALRHGLPWRDLTGDGLTLALGYELEEARERIKELVKACKNAADVCSMEFPGLDQNVLVLELRAVIDRAEGRQA